MKANLSTEGESSVTAESIVPTEKAADRSAACCVNDEQWCPGPESDELPCFDCFVEGNR